MEPAFKVLMGHCYYREPGGEDASFEDEVRLLIDRGHPVIRYSRDNREIDDFGLAEKWHLAWKTTWAADSYRSLRELIRRERPAVAHFQNTFPLISPAAYAACRAAGVPVVQSLRNYRLLCPNALFFREGRVCEDCLGKALPWPGVAHGCYRESRIQSGVVAAMVAAHRLLRTWQDQVDVYIALTDFARRKFIEGGLPPEKIIVKPNFVHDDAGVSDGRRDYALFVGRLSPEKGILTLLEAWRQIRRVPLKIVGEGPMREEMAAIVQRQGLEGSVELLGHRPRADVLALMRRARFLVFPSEWYETFGRVAIEAFACGVPVIAARLGAMAEIVDAGRTGLHFTPGDSDDLASQVEWAASHPDRVAGMGRSAREEFEAKYTAVRNYEMLTRIYRLAAERSGRVPAAEVHGWAA